MSSRVVVDPVKPLAKQFLNGVDAILEGIAIMKRTRDAIERMAVAVGEGGPTYNVIDEELGLTPGQGQGEVLKNLLADAIPVLDAPEIKALLERTDQG